MHGGLLRIEEWEARYKTVSAELELVETREMERPAVEKEGEEGEEESEEGDEDEGEEEEGEEGEEEENVGDQETVAESQATPKATPARTPRARCVKLVSSLRLFIHMGVQFPCPLQKCDDTRCQ